MDSYLGIFLGTFLASFAFGITKCAYNVLFHPLRRFPGPIGGRATRMYQTYYKLTGILPFKTKELHDKYGSVVRIAPDELSYNTSEAWQDICGHRSGTKNSSFEKDELWYGATKFAGEAHSIVTAKDDDHRRMRKLQSHAFSEKALNSQEPYLMKHVDMLMTRLWEKVNDKAEGGKVDVVRWYNFTTFDVIGELSFGRSFGCLETGEMHGWVELVLHAFKSTNAFQAFIYLPRIVTGILSLLVPKSILEKREKHFAFAKDIARQRVDAGVHDSDGQHDFMYYILRANDEKGMTGPEIESSTQLFLIAGSETSASLLSGCTYYLLKNPSVLSRLIQEIRSNFTHGSQITLATILHLPYLNAVLEESLRVFPPVAGTLPRLVPANGEIVCGEWLPGGTIVGINQWAANYSSLNFHLSESFIPERWLGDPKFAMDDRKAMQSFSYGPRNCIGKNLAYSEMRLILTKLLWNFDLELSEESEGWAEKTRSYVLWDKEQLWVKLKAAEREE